MKDMPGTMALPSMDIASASRANAVQTFAARNQGRDKAGQIVFRNV